MDINEMTRKEFEAVPSREWNEDIGEFVSLVILPSRHIHDSGYRCMDFVACNKDGPIKRLSGCSDVIHIGGIGGYNTDCVPFPNKIDPTRWSIDCLPKSGLLRIFTHGIFTHRKLTVGPALSSFDVYSTRE